jgi:hypothetical protein
MNRDLIENLAKSMYSKKGFFNKEDFKRDFRKIFTIKQMIKRFNDSKNINEKLLVNNILIIVNSFGIKNTNLLLKLILEEKEQWSVAKTILIFLYSYIEDSEDITEVDYVMKNILLEDDMFLFRKEDHQ